MTKRQYKSKSIESSSMFSSAQIQSLHSRGLKTIEQVVFAAATEVGQREIAKLLAVEKETFDNILARLLQMLPPKAIITENRNIGSKVDITTKSNNSFEETYIYTLRHDARDIEDKLLRAGTMVIHHPDASGEFLEDTACNRRIFKEKHYAWSDAIRQTVWFPPHNKWSETLEADISRSRFLCQEFVAAIDNNIISSVGYSIPDVNLSPMFYSLAWMPKIIKVESVADLSDKFIEGVCRNGHLPENIIPSSEWQDVLRGCNSLKIFSINSRFGSFYVVSAFVTPFLFSKPGEIAFTQPGPAIPDIIQSLYAVWCSNQPNSKFTFYTIGSSKQWKDGAKAVVGSKYLTLLSAPNKIKKWDTISPPQFAAGLYLRNFLDRLRPETRQQRISYVKYAVDEYIQSGYDGNILLDKITQKTGYRRTVVKEAFKVIQDSKHYECYKVAGQLAIRGVSGRKPRNIRIEIESGFARYHGGMLGGAIISVASWRIGTLIGGENLNVVGLMLGGLFVYLGKCVEVALNRKITE